MTPTELSDIALLDQLPTKHTFTFQSASGTHIGRVRPVNEDAFLNAEAQNLWVVADGIGGHKRGDYASKLVVKTLEEFVQGPSLVDNIKNLETRLIDANTACLKAFKGKKTGTTVALLYVFGHTCFFVWAGDSRVYRLRQGQLELMTEDHNVAQEKYSKGELSQEQAANHPTSHLLTRAVGAHRQLHLGLRYSELYPGDRYLICSDGLYGDLNIDIIKTGLTKKSPKIALQELIDKALEAGGKDNITAIVIDSSLSEK